MNCPDAVIKHDERRVAFDAARLEASILRAALSAPDALPAEAATRVAREIASTVGAEALNVGKSVIATAEIRALCIQALSALGFQNVADAYQYHARESLSLLRHLRVIEMDMPRDGSAGWAWDRRRLIESMRESGIAPDPAAAAARDVERRVLALGRERVSPALIHALTQLALPADCFGAQTYAARRIAFSAAQQHPHPNATLPSEDQLPGDSAALEQFWIQSVHSPEVVEAVRDNLLSIRPCPSSADATLPDAADSIIDPLTTDGNALVEQFRNADSTGLKVRADSTDRIDLLSSALAQISAAASPTLNTGGEIVVHFRRLNAKNPSLAPRVLPVTINAGGLLPREALRDPQRAAARLGELAGIAARAHREREAYFERSATRGRVLPIAVSGLWNATAWLQGGGFDTTRAPIGARAAIAPLCQALRLAINTLRAESGMDLMLTATAPSAAERRLWHNDRCFFLDDGQKLNAASAYETGLKLSTAMGDFVDRLDFVKTVGESFDEPPMLSIDAGFASETSAAQWLELLEGVANAGLASLTIALGDHARPLPNLTRAIRSYRAGFPLLDALERV